MQKDYEVITVETESGGFQNYSYIVFNTLNKASILIDPSWESKKIDKQIKDRSSFVSTILLTHHHDDHTNLVNYYINNDNNKQKVNVYISKKEADFYGFQCENLNLFKFTQDLNFNGLRFTPIHTPGHTKGATCYLLEDNLFTGDTLYIKACGNCSGYGSSAEEMFNSLQHLKKVLTKNTKIFPAHPYGNLVGSNFEEVIKHNKYLQIDNLQKFVEYRMDSSINNKMSFQ